MAMTTTIPMTIKSSSSSLSSSSRSSSLAMTIRDKKYSAEWIDLLSSESYSSSEEEELKSPLQLCVTITNNIPGDRLFAFGGYAEEVIIDNELGSSIIVNRHVVNDMWHFLPYTNNVSSWGWTLRNNDNNKDYVPPSRLATAIAVLPSNNDSPQAVLLGGWDPQTPGTGGVILDDVTMLDIDTLEWSRCIDDAMDKGEEFASLPDGPTSRHVAVHLSISKHRNDNNKHDGGAPREDIIYLHNHRCDDHILQLSITTDAKEGTRRVRWDHQATTGKAPSSRGLHCATTIHQSTAMVLFGGAAKDGLMSNESFVLDTETWKWTKLDCNIGDDDNNTAARLPAPRAGACLCSLDEKSVLLFGGATPGEKGLVGLNDVWVLTVNKDSGRGTWDCLIEHQNDNDGDIKIDDGILRPPGRNAASLNEIDIERLLPKDIIWKRSGSSSEGKCKYFLLNGGWYPFRKTYNDIFLLRISPEE